MSTFVWLQGLVKINNSWPESKQCLKRKTRNPHRASATYRRSWKGTQSESRRSKPRGSQATRRPRRCSVTWAMASSKLQRAVTLVLFTSLQAQRGMARKLNLSASAYKILHNCIIYKLLGWPQSIQVLTIALIMKMLNLHV